MFLARSFYPVLYNVKECMKNDATFAGHGRIALFGLAFISMLFAGTTRAQSGDDDRTRAGRFDNGKMWTFDNPPIDYFREEYDFAPDSAWFSRARLGALRIPGCSASFVSSYGLVLTNHHCGRNAVSQVTLPGEQLTENGFYAGTLDEERRVPGYYADQLIAIQDVTDEIDAAVADKETEAERAAARQEAIEAVKARIEAEAGAGHIVEIIPLYHGGQYAAYTFRRYDDVRLVMTPELQIGYYGGDWDNFTYPRYTLDITFFRVYEDGRPFEPDHFFLWSLDGAQAGDAVFVVGNPGSTSRLETVAQLEVRRDVTDKNLLHFIEGRIRALEAFQRKAPPHDKNAVRNPLFSLRNAQKAYRGQLKALNDPVIMARRRDAESRFQAAILADDALREKYGGLIEAMQSVQEELRALRKPHGAFFGLTSATFSSALVRRAMLAHTILERRQQGVDEQGVAELVERLKAVPDQPAGLDVELLAARLQDIAWYYGDDDPMTRAVLDGKTPAERAAEIVDTSALASAASTAETALADDDPAVAMIGHIIESYREFQSAFAGLSARQSEIAGEIGRARFAVYGTDVPPDATFSLRIADGVVKGYPYNGTYASPFTSFYGLYDHYYSYGPGSDWDLPVRWQTPPSTFNLAVPLNFASTNDIIGGNSGSPVLNEELELVGVIFDGNIESLSGNYIYLPEKARAVSVDARGILEALEEIYGAHRIILELTEDVLVSSESEADAR